MLRAVILRTDGLREEHIFEVEVPLKWLQTKVGGFIELVPNHVDVYCNEDALNRDLPINNLAREVLGKVAGTVDGNLRGDVVIVEPVQ